MKLLSKILLLMTISTITICANAQAKHVCVRAQAKYYGAIDLGSKGIKASLFSFVRGGEGHDACILDGGGIINTPLVSSMKDGEFTEAGIQVAADATKRLIDDMKLAAKKQDLDTVTYFIVGSSGVARAKNTDALASKVKQETGIDMEFITAAQEGYLGTLSIIPLSRRSSSMFIDVGSGNTKLGCMVGTSGINSFKSSEIPYGSVSGRNEGLKIDPKDPIAGIQRLMNDKVEPAYSKESMDTPCLRNRDRIYWVGGASWAVTTFMHPEHELDSAVILTRSDIEAFLEKLANGTWNQGELKYRFDRVNYHFPKDATPDQQAAIRARVQHQIREKATKERLDVMNVFVREDLYSGVSIMKTILDIANPSATIVFKRNGGFIYGYALEKYKEDQAGTSGSDDR